MRRIFLTERRLSPGILAFSGEQARYLSTVLRCRPGDRVSITDGTNTTFLCRILNISRREITAEVLGASAVDAGPSLRIVLLQGLLKGEKMDMVIQKATELGVHEVRPVVTERSEVRTTRKAGRWRKIAMEASRQCGRRSIPGVPDPAPLADFLDAGGRTGVIFWEEGGAPLREALSELSSARAQCPEGPLYALIGPEGGFSAGEVEKAADCGMVVASIGPRILRAETAAIAALSVIQYAVGDMGA